MRNHYPDATASGAVEETNELFISKIGKLINDHREIDGECEPIKDGMDSQRDALTDLLEQRDRYAKEGDDIRCEMADARRDSFSDAMKDAAEQLTNCRAGRPWEFPQIPPF